MTAINRGAAFNRTAFLGMNLVPVPVTARFPVIRFDSRAVAIGYRAPGSVVVVPVVVLAPGVMALLCPWRDYRPELPLIQSVSKFVTGDPNAIFLGRAVGLRARPTQRFPDQVVDLAPLARLTLLGAAQCAPGNLYTIGHALANRAMRAARSESDWIDQLCTRTAESGSFSTSTRLTMTADPFARIDGDGDRGEDAGAADGDEDAERGDCDTCDNGAIEPDGGRDYCPDCGRNYSP